MLLYEYILLPNHCLFHPPTVPCYAQEFRCRNYQRCVHDGLTCDGWDDCGDQTDEEEEAGCGLLTATEIGATIIAILLFIASIAVFTVTFVKYKRQMEEFYMVRRGDVVGGHN